MTPATVVETALMGIAVLCMLGVGVVLWSLQQGPPSDDEQGEIEGDG